MCLAVPARIVELEGDMAVVDAMGNRWKAKTTLLPEAKLGDLVLMHAGFAISLVDEEARRQPELPGLCSFLPEGQKYPALLVKHLDIFKLSVCNIDVAETISSDAARMGKVAGPVSLTAEHLQEPVFASKYLNPVVQRVADV